MDMFKGMNILVVGLARSGAAAANLLASLGANVTVTDRKSGEALGDSVKSLMSGIDLVTGDNPPELFDAADLIVISPGVPLYMGPLRDAAGRGIPVIGELELAYQAVAGSKLRVTGDTHDVETGTRKTEPATPPFIGITGTNGKSTVTTLTDLMLKESGYQTVLGGNIGNALTGEILQLIRDAESQEGNVPSDGIRLPHIDFIVTEISSFQLETVSEFKPKVAAILNISPDHLDRYSGMDDYINAKARIFENQTPDEYLVMNADDPAVMDMLRKAEAGGRTMPRTLYFSARREVEGIYTLNGVLYLNIPGTEGASSNLPFIGADEIRIKGAHNLENAMAASLIALLCGCSPQAAKNVLRDFRGLEHRLEYVESINGVTYINDSKGTNTGAVAKSLESLRDVILIMGGLDKGGDFSVLRDQVKAGVKRLILLGAAKEKIAEALGDITESEMVGSLKEAVERAASRASRGDTVLLSPGCASFDMFKDFEDRGRKFREAVRGLLK